MGLSAFLFSFLTDFALVPALLKVINVGRHFEVFLGFLQLFSSLGYNLCLALGLRSLFLKPLDWHFVSDVSSLAYVCCLIVHLRASPNKGLNILLRYTAFALAWFFKLRDGWDSGSWEGVLIGAFVVVSLIEVM